MAEENKPEASDVDHNILDTIRALRADTSKTDKERTSAVNKQIAESKNLSADVVAMGSQISTLGREDQKKLASTLQSQGAEVSDREEQRGRELQDWLVKFANQEKRRALDLKKSEATGLAKAGLTVQSGLMAGFHNLQEGWMNIKNAIENNAQLSTIGNALQQDFQMLTMAFSEIMNMPGMKTIVATLKYIASWLGKIMLPWLKTFWTWIKAKGKDILGIGGKKEAAAAVPLRKDGQPDMRYAVNKTKKDGLKGVAETADTAGLTPAPAAAAVAGKDALKEKAGASPKGMRGLNKTLKSIERPIKKLAKQVRKFINLLQGIFGVVIMKKLSKAAIKHRAATGMFTKTLKFLTGAFMKAVKGMMKAIKRFAMVMIQFLIQIGLFIVNMIIAIAGFIIANLPLIALIALVVLVAIGYYMLIKYIMDNWETIKVKMAMAMDRLKLVGTKIANWFKDLGADIGYRIRQLVAKIKDGLVWVINTALEAFADMMPDGPLGRRAAAKIRSFKMEEGAASAKVQADREQQLAARETRDAQLEADFEAKYAERGKELEEAAKKDAERKAGKDTKQGDSSQANINVQTDNREVSYVAENTRSNDMAATQAMMLAG